MLLGRRQYLRQQCVCVCEYEAPNLVTHGRNILPAPREYLTVGGVNGLGGWITHDGVTNRRQWGGSQRLRQCLHPGGGCDGNIYGSEGVARKLARRGRVSEYRGFILTQLVPCLLCWLVREYVSVVLDDYIRAVSLQVGSWSVQRVHGGRVWRSYWTTRAKYRWARCATPASAMDQAAPPVPHHPASNDAAE